MSRQDINPSQAGFIFLRGGARMTCKDRLLDLFNTHRISYRVHSLGRGRAKGGQGTDDFPVASVTVAFRAGRPVMLVTAADRDPNPWAISRVLGREGARLATESELEILFPDCEGGAIPAIGALYGMPVFLDTDLARQPEITFLTGTLDESVTIGMRSFEHLIWPIHASLVMPSGKVA